ncbi:LytTR family DNA-binding domain-containing protein [Chitinophaga horti]|uniref:LytTR family DNA-binding domain-containing protein n=1 Tax=Chitinophaga horti TaxID=2920382 RepID=A0ABY6J887_9BACT|nr:LytTR family DNA-binding domain-containing protein [Chitinophaga horti]UYQ95817.1 LytTR family DNA-binding domain-containing protein [Chitinophaga horti]
MMIKCVLVDDEPRNLSLLKKMLNQYCPDITVSGKAETLDEAVDVIATVRPQLVFLDIEMHTGNAFDLLDRLSPVNFEVILVTAHDHYAVKGFKYNALDFILKPIEIDDLRRAVSKAEKRIREQDIGNRLNELIPQLRPDKPLGKIALRDKEGFTLYAFEEILYCSAEGAYTRFGFQKGSSLLVSGSLKEFEAQLPSETFCRIHDSHLVNLNHVRKYHNGKGGSVEMTDGRVLEVSVRKKAEFLARLK